MGEEKHIRVLFVRLFFFFNDTGALHVEKPIYNQISHRKEEWCLLHTMFSLASKPQQMSFPLPGKLCLDPYAQESLGTFLGSMAPMLGSEGPSGAVSIYPLSYTQVRKTERRSCKESNYLAAGGRPRCQDQERGWERKWEVEPAEVPSAIRVQLIVPQDREGRTGGWQNRAKMPYLESQFSSPGENPWAHL